MSQHGVKRYHTMKMACQVLFLENGGEYIDLIAEMFTESLQKFHESLCFRDQNKTR